MEKHKKKCRIPKKERKTQTKMEITKKSVDFPKKRV